ncbi:hypothetical protein MKEN_00228600 [Mycena kentingensis (nom. inval.)]|nr:hypothetical protein MKEN_00228600 [Mycena kentingensis (nom. inval.)]
MTSPTPLRALLNLMSDAVDTIESTFAAASLTFPALDSPKYDHADPAEVLCGEPAVAKAISEIIAAAAQITAAVRHPLQSAVLTACYFHLASALRVSSELNLVELMREAGPEGLSIEQLSEQSKARPEVISKILRILATFHIFREIAPGVFTNNRISSIMDKGKPSKELFEGNREDRFVGGTGGTAALVEFCGDEIFKGSSLLAETVLDTNPDGEKVPIKRALGFTQPSMFQWFESTPENKFRVKRFGAAMHGTSTVNSDVVFLGFDWSQLPEGSTIVDVGSGPGSTPLAIAKRYPTLKVVCQDLAGTAEAAKTVRSIGRQTTLSTSNAGWSSFRATHDFFNPQPASIAGNADIYIMRHCIHNWQDEPSIKILSHLRAAAKPTTQLVLMESILPVVSGGEEEDPRVKDIPGAIRPSAPAPLLANGGVGSARIYSMDMTMLNLLMAGERTVAGYVELLDKAGWKVVRIHRLPGIETCHIVASPI